MKVLLLKELLALYDTRKSIWRRASGVDPNKVTLLKGLAGQEVEVDRDLTPQELYEVFVLLLPPKGSSRQLPKAAEFLFNNIRAHSKNEYNAAALLHSATPSFFNEENFSALMQHFHHIEKIMEIWGGLPPQLRTKESLELLQDQVDYLDEISKSLLNYPMSGRYMLVDPTPENFLKICFTSLLSSTTSYAGYGTPEIVIKDFPIHLLTLVNLKNLRDVFIPPKEAAYENRNHYMAKAKILRNDIMKSIILLPKSLRTQESFELLCRKKHVIDASSQFRNLPLEFQTFENLSSLLSIKQNALVIGTFRGLAPGLQTQENFINLIVTAKNCQDGKTFLGVYFNWETFPPALQTLDNFTMLHKKNDKLNQVYHLTRYFRDLGIEGTQENFIKLLSLKFTSNDTHDLETFSVDFFNRLCTNDIINNDLTRLNKAGKAWKLFPKNLKTEVNFDLLVRSEIDKGENAEAIHFLFSSMIENLRTQENFNEIISQAKIIKSFLDVPIGKEIVRVIAQIGRFVGQEIFSYIINIAKLDEHAANLTLYKQFSSTDFIFRHTPAQFRTQENFNIIFNNAANSPDFGSLPEAWELLRLLPQVPPHLFGQNLFNLVVDLAQAANQAARTAGLNRIRAHVEQVLPRGHARNEGNINVRQSTHTSSVHKSVSKSAIGLMDHYSEQIDNEKKLDGVIEALRSWVTKINVDDLGLDDEKMGVKEIVIYKADLAKQLKAANRAIINLVNPSYAFVDPTSKVSIRQLIALVWVALNDDVLCTAPRQDAMRKMIIGLYDIQRGYNLTEDFREVNTQSPDRAICTSGTFNKLMEIPWGIHPLVQLIYLTTQLAGQRIPKAVMELVREHLADMPEGEAKSEDDRTELKKLVNSLMEEGVVIVWDKIKLKLAKRIYEEYGTLYEGGIKDPKFIELIDTGQYVDLEEMRLDKYFDKLKLTASTDGVSASVVSPVLSDAVSASATSSPLSAVESTDSASSSLACLMPNDTISPSSNSSSMGFFSSPNKSASASGSWLISIGNRLDNEIIAVGRFDSKIKAGLLDLKELFNQLNNGEYSLEHIGKLEKNILRLIEEVRQGAEEVSMAQEGSMHCLATLSAISDELMKIKQSMIGSRPGSS